ncbi:MAG: nucleotidyltransferase family protein [Candidatus Firestonebacteria bacterium]
MTKEEIKNIILKNEILLKKYKVISISLFGSYVRNEQKKNSDIDFLVEFDKDVTLFELIDFQNCLSEILEKDVSVVSKNGLNKYVEPYILREAEAIG